MNNRFEEVMSKKTDEALRFILEAPEGTYQEEALTAARQEWEKRTKREVTPDETATRDEQVVLPDELIHPGENDVLADGVSSGWERLERPTSPLLPTVRYKTLRFIAGFYQVLAWLVLVLVILALAGLIVLRLLTWWQVLAVLLGSVLLFVTLLAVSELIRLFIVMERNTRHGVNHQ